MTLKLHRRNFVKYGVAIGGSTAIAKEASAFAGVFLALIGRTSLSALARAAGSSRATSLASAAARARYNSSPQFTVSTGADITFNLRPRLRVRNPNSQSMYKSPRIYIRELNLTFNQTREFELPSFDFPPNYQSDFDVNLDGVRYDAGCDYLREIVSVDECGCEARWQPEAICILGNPNDNGRGVSISPPTIPPSDGRIIHRPGDRNPCPYAGTVPIEWVNGSVRCGPAR